MGGRDRAGRQSHEQHVQQGAAYLAWQSENGIGILAFVFIFMRKRS